MLWALAVSALVLAVLEPGFGLDRLGLRMPDRYDLRSIGIPTYAATAVPIAFHVLLDLRALLIRQPTPVNPPTT